MRARLRAAAVLSVTALGVGLGVAPYLPAAGTGETAGRVAVDQSYPAPASGRYTVRGHGWGHGHGMSQYGAEGAAREGLTHEQILRFYYPGTRLGEAKGRIRVLITADTTTDLVVEARSGLEVHDLGSGEWHPLPRNGATRWRLDVDGANRSVVDYYEDGTWRRWQPGGAPALSGLGEFRADGPLTLLTPSGEAVYRGRLRAVASSVSASNRDTVNVVGLDAYVRGVVASEMPASWSPEAVQAQAVAARTYGARARVDNQGDAYQICDTTSCQVYHGVEGEHPDSDAAVQATAGQILRYDGQPAFAQFSSSSGGWTSAGSQPYLVAKADPYDDVSINPNHDWSVPLRVARIENAYPRLGNLRRIRVTARDGNGQWQGRVLTLVLVGSRNNVTLSGDTFRSVFGLKSTWFSF